MLEYSFIGKWLEITCKELWWNSVNDSTNLTTVHEVIWKRQQAMTRPDLEFHHSPLHSLTDQRKQRKGTVVCLLCLIWSEEIRAHNVFFTVTLSTPFQNALKSLLNQEKDTRSNRDSITDDQRKRQRPPLKSPGLSPWSYRWRSAPVGGPSWCLQVTVLYRIWLELCHEGLTGWCS